MTGGAARVLVRAPNWLGDAVLALPALAALRRHFAGAHLTIAAPAGLAALFREETDARPDAVLPWPAPAREARAALRAGRFDVGVLFPNSFRSAWLLWRAGIGERWGYPTAGRGMLLTRRSRRARGGGRHHGDYYRALVRGLGVDCGDEPPRLGVTDASRAEAARLLAAAGPDAPLVGVAPGAAYGASKQWPPDRVAALVARLARERGARAVVVGAAHDRPAARAIESWLRAEAPDVAARVVDLVGRTSTGALAGVLARCDAFVSNDSGAMHVAAAVGRPVVAVFGSTDERATGPVGAGHAVLTEPVFCRPCMLRECPIDHRCMKRITVDRVASAVLTALDAGPAA